MKSVALLSTVYLYFNPISAAIGDDWGYDDVDKWADAYAECGQEQQSPIDVVFLPTWPARCDEPLLLDWTPESMPFVIQNTGFSLKATPFLLNNTGGDGFLSSIEALHHTNDTDIRLANQFYDTYTSPVNKEYCFDSLHFHWGEDDSAGSEHTYNGETYPLELYFVHYSCDYLSLGPAVDDYVSGEVTEDPYDDEHVLAVIGVVFEIGEANPVLDSILNNSNFEGIRKYDLSLYYTEFDMNGLLPDNKEFLAYKGSLTTPPCYETVRWHNMKTPMTVSQAQMAKFRQLSSSSNLNDSQAPNYRPVQPRGDRKVYQCKEDVLGKTVEKVDLDEWNELISSIADDSVVADDEYDNTWPLIGVMSMFFTFLALAAIVHLYPMAYGKDKDKGKDGQEEASKKAVNGVEEQQKYHAIAMHMQTSEEVGDVIYKDTPKSKKKPEPEEEEPMLEEDEAEEEQSMDVGTFTNNLEDQLKAMENRLASSKNCIE